jgi:hypothetical protein
MVEISKLSLRSMLYPGATTKIRAHFMGWFGDNGHVNPGYKSNDPGRVSLQVTDMKASGIDSAILDWYGQFNPTINGTGLLLKAEQMAGCSFIWRRLESQSMSDSPRKQRRRCAGCLTQILLTFSGAGTGTGKQS